MVWERMSIHVPLQQLADNIHAAEEVNDYQRPCACTRCREQHRSKAEDQREKKAVLNEQSQIGCSETERFAADGRSEEHTSELQSLMRISYAVFCLKKNKAAKQ